MQIDPKKMQQLNEYLDEISPANRNEPHPFLRFELNEIVHHSEFGWGIVTGFRIPDRPRELEGMGIQFVQNGRMMVHRVFTARECDAIECSGIEFDVLRHKGKTLEEVVAEKNA